MRRQLLKQALSLDMDAFTPSDFCLMGINMRFEDYTPDAMETSVKDFFREEHGIEDI